MNKKKTISEEQKDLIEEFSFFEDWQEKYEHIIDNYAMNIFICWERLPTRFRSQIRWSE